MCSCGLSRLRRTRVLGVLVDRCIGALKSRAFSGGGVVVDFFGLSRWRRTTVYMRKMSLVSWAGPCRGLLSLLSAESIPGGGFVS